MFLRRVLEVCAPLAEMLENIFCQPISMTCRVCVLFYEFIIERFWVALILAKMYFITTG